MLTFFNVSEEDYGNYTCVAVNTLGITNASIILYGKSLPLITKHVNLCTQPMSSVTWRSRRVKYLPGAIKSTSRRLQAPTNADDFRAVCLWRFLACRVPLHITFKRFLFPQAPERYTTWTIQPRRRPARSRS